MTMAVDAVRDTPFVVGGRTFHSRLMVGTGKYRDNETMARAIEASGAEVVTVAVRRVDLDRSKETGILHHLDPNRYVLLANTAGCFTADDAVRYARLAREAGFNEFRSEEHTSELQSPIDISYAVFCLKKKKKKK